MIVLLVILAWFALLGWSVAVHFYKHPHWPEGVEIIMGGDGVDLTMGPNGIHWGPNATENTEAVGRN